MLDCQRHLVPRSHLREGVIILIATCLVSAALGSIHAFSVFLEPLETQFTASRSTASLTYSLALVSLTAAVLLGPRIFARWSAATLILAACSAAAFGALMAGMASSVWMVWVGYSLIFGAANGIGYGYGLQISAQVNPGREGMAMGAVTAAYAFGAILSPALFDIAMNSGGFSAAMTFLAVTILGIGLLSAVLLRSVNAAFLAQNDLPQSQHVSTKRLPLMWLGYFGGVLAGLMVIGHAAGIAASLEPGMALWVAPMIIAACNLLGSLVGGRLADKFPLGPLLAAFSLITCLALAAITGFGGFLIGLGAVGFAYGGTIAAYPAAIAKLFGMESSPKIYGRIFTAWGAAGLLGPWFAGYLFDLSGNYSLALITAAAIALTSSVITGFVIRAK
jgi:OFA family oxalate/formate antiporter-like MFS transporter